MDEQSQELIKRYKRYIRRKKIIIFLILLLLLAIGCIFFKSKIYYPSSNSEDKTIPTNTIEEEPNYLEINNIIEEVISNELVETTKEIPKTKEIQNTKESEKKTNDKKNNSNNKSSSNSKKNTNQKNKPPNKDFLFTDGYNMNNVSQAAYEYLNSSGFAGECRPIKDDDGIYLGMRVIFY